MGQCPYLHLFIIYFTPNKTICSGPVSTHVATLFPFEELNRRKLHDFVLSARVVTLHSPRSNTSNHTIL